MASVKNTARRKRKYGEGQKARTAANKASKKAAAERRAARLIARTQALIGKRVQVRTTDGPLVGTVREIVAGRDVPADPDSNVRRNGQFLRVADQKREAVVARRRAKVL